MGEVVGTDLICSVHYHEKHTIRVCVLPGGVLSPPQNPRWTKALSLARPRERRRSQDKRDRRARGTKRAEGGQEPPSGGRGKHSAVCSVGMNFHHLTLFIALLSDVLYFPLFIPGETHCIYYQV